MTSDSDINAGQQSSSSSFDDLLFLSSSDQLNLQLVSYLFNSDNFVHWKRDVSVALVVNNKVGFIDVMKWILNSIEKNLKDTLQYVITSKELWTKILNRNEHIESLDPLPLSSCGVLDSCTCQLLKKTMARDNKAKLIQFLMGLIEGYESVKTHLLTMDPLPPLNKEFALLQNVEKQIQLHDSTDSFPESAAFHSSSKELPQNSWKKSKTECFKLKYCSFCEKKGHARDTCFKLKPNLS
ncbi:hypothetical protein RND81_01G081000 [Saponaria officinalis]|uniref:Retrotransposon Copia-like N-terminal domain-containing protein n=1 Tax=Saponaria officinalis TaxID=3572 RepID=A0AAW1NF72_SAPOF